MCKIEKELEDIWLEIIEKNIIITTHQILEENVENTKVIVKSTQFLQPFLQDQVKNSNEILTTSSDLHQSKDVEMDPFEGNEEICVNIKEKK